jgi:hypothetical protein
MRTIYAVWHQAEGVVATHVFYELPTEAQMQALRGELEKRHNRPDMEMRVRPMQLLGADELPEFNVVANEPFGVSGEGSIG